jgi:hypothetical protein
MNALLNPTVEQFEYYLSEHAITRASQRGITKSVLEFMILNGELIKKQGLKYYFMTKNTLKYFDLNLQDKLRNLIVIMSSDGCVITCYKNENGIKHIKHKSKRLAKYSANRSKYKD